MNKQAKQAPPQRATDWAHIRRSDFLDQFAGVEEQIAHVSKIFGFEPGNSPTSQAIKKLLETKKPAALSEQADKMVREALTKFSELQAIRADVVHSCLQVGSKDGIRYALFSNARHATSIKPSVARLTEAEFETKKRELQSLRDKLRKALNPSRPQPKPAAATDP